MHSHRRCTRGHTHTHRITTGEFSSHTHTHKHTHTHTHTQSSAKGRTCPAASGSRWRASETRFPERVFSRGKFGERSRADGRRSTEATLSRRYTTSPLALIPRGPPPPSNPDRGPPWFGIGASHPLLYAGVTSPRTGPPSRTPVRPDVFVPNLSFMCVPSKRILPTRCFCFFSFSFFVSFLFRETSRFYITGECLFSRKSAHSSFHSCNRSSGSNEIQPISTEENFG